MELELRRNPEGNDGAIACDDENSMDSLQPPKSLKLLVVDGYMGVRFSSWLSFLTNLVKLNIGNCKKCQYFPPLYQLPSLRQLHIRQMYGLEYMTDGDINNEISASPSAFFPSLERFYLENCPNLKGWWRRDILDKGKEAIATSTIPLPSFPRLSFFSFWDCPKMTTWMPLFPNLEGLYMINTSWKPLEQTIEMKMMNTASSFPSSSSYPLSKLKDLNLREGQDLESLPEEWLKSLTSLENLEILGCPNLTSVPEGMS